MPDKHLAWVTCYQVDLPGNIVARWETGEDPGKKAKRFRGGLAAPSWPYDVMRTKGGHAGRSRPSQTEDHRGLGDQVDDPQGREERKRREKEKKEDRKIEDRREEPRKRGMGAERGEAEKSARDEDGREKATYNLI